MSTTSTRNSLKRTLQDAELDSPLPPIVFSTPGIQPDVRMMVFDQEYHVNSVVLKLKSAFFRKFLDSPEKKSAPATSAFKYDYIATVHDEGDWALEPVSNAPKVTPESYARIPDHDHQKACFNNLLCAMYGRRYRILSCEQLYTITTLADYYCALPALSISLSGALVGSPIFATGGIYDIYPIFTHHSVSGLLQLAKKLRHPELFRECFIHVASVFELGSFSTGDWLLLRQDKELWGLLKDAHLEMYKRIQEVNCLMMETWIKNPDLDPPNLFDFDDETLSDKNPIQEAVVYRKLRNLVLEMVTDSGDPTGMWSRVYESIEQLFRNNLVFNTSNVDAGEAIHKHQFLCTDIDDEDMPWDVTKPDW